MVAARWHPAKPVRVSLHEQTSGAKSPRRRRCRRTMSARNRLHLLWAIALIAPTIAVLVLILDRATAPSVAEGRAQQGLRTAFLTYGGARTQARAELRSISTDPRLRTAFMGGSSRELERRATELVRDNPRIAAVQFDTVGRQRVMYAGSSDAVAFAASAPATSGGRRLGTLAASTTTAPEFAARVRRVTGLEVRLLRGSRPLASTLGPLADTTPAQSGKADIGGRDYSSAYGTAP